MVITGFWLKWAFLIFCRKLDTPALVAVVKMLAAWTNALWYVHVCYSFAIFSHLFSIIEI